MLIWFLNDRLYYFLILFFDTLLREDCFLDKLCALNGLHWTWSLEMDLCTLFLVCLCILPYRLFLYRRSDPKNYNLFSGFINAPIVIQHSVRTMESFLIITKTSLVSWSSTDPDGRRGIWSWLSINVSGLGRCLWKHGNKATSTFITYRNRLGVEVTYFRVGNTI